LKALIPPVQRAAPVLSRPRRAGVTAPRVVVAGGHSAGHVEPDALRRLEPTAGITTLGSVRAARTPTLVPAPAARSTRPAGAVAAQTGPGPSDQCRAGCATGCGVVVRVRAEVEAGFGGYVAGLRAGGDVAAADLDDLAAALRHERPMNQQGATVCRHSAESHLPESDGAADTGSCTVTRSPPSGRGARVRVPSCACVMLLTIARPRPTPAWPLRIRPVPR